MKYWGIILLVGIGVLLLLLSVTPSKKLKCIDDMCMVMEKTFWKPKPRLKQYFFKSDILGVQIENRKGVDYLVLNTKAAGDIYLKFIHTSKTAFKSKQALTTQMNKFFKDLIETKKDYESPWQRDVGSIQIYLYGKPLFN